MIKVSLKTLFTFLFLSTLFIGAQAQETEEVELSEEEMLEFYDKYVDSLKQTFEYQTGTVTLNLDSEIGLTEGTATLNVPEGFRFLNADDSKIILSEIWGNPPSETLGLIFPADSDFDSDNSFAIDVTYDGSGFVKDEDASEIDYDDLLEGMQKDVAEVNIQREELGYPTYELVGWAAKPYYDAENKKLHWAKEVLFDGEESATLNYAIRILGRKGVLQMNFISDISLLGDVEKSVPQILPNINFDKGSTYAEFNPGMDKVAAYGIGGLIAGKVLAKAGFFVVLLKFWKIIAVAVVAGFAAIKKFITGRDDS